MGLTGSTVGTGFVPIKPDTKGFGDELERGVTAEGKAGAKRAGDGIGKELSLAMKGAFAAGVAVIGKSVFDFAGFDKGMREVFTLLPDISKPAMDEMTGQVKDFAQEFGVLPTEVIPALYQSLSAGVPKDNVFAFMETAQKLAKGGVTELATAVDGLSSVVNAYGADVTNVDSVSNMMFTTVKLGKTTIEDLSTNLFQVTPIAASLHLQFSQVSAAMATLTLVTGNTSVASTQLKAALAELGKGGSTAFDNFKEATGQTFPDFIAAGGDLGAGLVQLQTYAEANGKTLGDMFGSVEAGQAALVLAKDNAASFSSNLEEMQNAAGATDAAFATMNTGLSATMDRLKARFAVTLIDLGGSIAPALESFGMAIAGLLDALNQLPAPLRTGIILGATLLAGIAGFAGPIMKAVQLFGMLGKAMTALAMNPWMLAIGVLALGAYLIITHWEEVKKFFGDLVGWFDRKIKMIKRIWKPLIEGDWWGVAEVVDNIFGNNGTFIAPIRDTLQWMEDRFDAVAGFFDTWADRSVAIFDGFTAGVRAVFEELDNFFTVWAERFEFVFSHLFDWLSSAWSTTWDVITEVTTAAADAFQTVVQPLVDVLQVVIPAALGVMRAAFDVAWSAISSVVSTAWGVIRPIFDAIKGRLDDASGAMGFLLGVASVVFNVLRSIVETACAAIVSAINSVKTAAEKALGPVGSVLSKAGGGLKDAGQWLVGHDDGGVVGGGPRGAPMPILAHVGETVLPTHKMPIENFLGGAAGAPLVVETHLHVDAGIADDDARFRRLLETASTELTRVVQRELDRSDRGAGRTPLGALAA